ncbi:hypothetical protein SCLCIDRAFT_125380 [Scleroderma citrinum Foug A]|uniref:Uncharacterized protein n=1 Tax=Scleroderma citrinum Foug A TaxID=1036808 RepID=A0A0C3DGL6_9AGAM|nr:hypothetical protein SCLCIDRAFT_125380 [Scleroderma citrinum Foug A]
MAGRRTTLINGILDEGYNDLENILTQLVNKTALSPQQIMDGWHKSKGQVISGVNHWNLYAKYLAKHKDQEWQRLGLFADLYTKFKEENNEAWQEILKLHDLLENSEASPQTITHRIQSFSRIKWRLINLVEGAAAKHGFEAVLVMCGKVVNEDVSLGFTHTTAGVKKFFETWCRSNEHAMIGHLKAHV